MKIIRGKIGYVNIKDLIGYGFPKNIDFDKESYSDNDYVILRNKEDIEYIKNRDDIVDYDSVFSLSNEELDEKIKKIEKDLEPLYLQFSNTSFDNKLLLIKDLDFKSNLCKLDKIYYDLIHYRNNREEEDERVYNLLNDNNVSKTFSK